MKTSKEFKDDPIRHYFRPGLVEQAPEGFTEALMTRVTLEAGKLKAGTVKRQTNYVPVISLAVILILTVLALTLTSSGDEFVAVKWMNVLRNATIPSLNLNLESLLKFRLPVYLLYILASLLCLSFFDRALSVLFHRGK